MKHSATFIFRKMEESSLLREFNMNWFDYSLSTKKYFAYKHGFLYGPHLIHHHIRVHQWMQMPRKTRIIGAPMCVLMSSSRINSAEIRTRKCFNVQSTLTGRILDMRSFSFSFRLDAIYRY
jgi:hypothetical protein